MIFFYYFQLGQCPAEMFRIIIVFVATIMLVQYSLSNAGARTQILVWNFFLR